MLCARSRLYQRQTYGTVQAERALEIKLAGLYLALPGAAQNTSKFSFNVGGGFTSPVRYTDGRMNTGFNINVGAGVYSVTLNPIVHFNGKGRFDPYVIGGGVFSVRVRGDSNAKFYGRPCCR